jgi:hypothetical protein
MRFEFSGFEHDHNQIRQFGFDVIEADRKRTRFTVGVDLALIRKYDISVQELPLLCRCFLEGHAGDGLDRRLTFSEDEMIQYSNRRAVAVRSAADEKTSRRREGLRSGIIG